MKEQCRDVFAEYNLPLETYFYDCQNHDLASHDDLEIIWVLKGRAFLEVEGVVHEMHDSTVFLVYLNQEHALVAEKDTIMIAYRLKNDYLKRRGLFFEKVPYKGEVLTFDYLADKYRQVPLLLVQFLKLLLSKDHNEMVYYKIIAYYNFYIAEIYKMFLKEHYLDIKTLDYDEYLSRSQIIVDYIYNHYQDQITLSDLQQKINLSHSRLSHFIKEAFGIPFQEFVQNVRFEHALTLLRATKFSMYEIAKISGFSDQKYLNQMMKKHLNMTALKYRKCHKQKIKQFNEHKEDGEQFLEGIRECIINLEKDPRFKTLFEIEPIYECIY